MEFIKLKSKRFILSLVVFAITFILLGIPFFNWGFLHDDFGVVWHSQIKNIKDILKFFTGAGMTVTVQPSNYMPPEQSFLVVYYRPFVYIFYALQMLFFKFNAYGYFLVTIFLHAINAVILFNLLFPFTSWIFAFWGAMFFAFHPSLINWLGWIAGQAHILNFTLILLVILFLKKYLETRNIIDYWSAFFIFLISLFTRETAIIIPIWIMYAAYLYENYLGANKKSFFGTIYKYLRLTIPFWLGVIFYFVVRFSFYPIKFSGPSQIELSPLTFLSNLKGRFFDLVTFLSDVFGLSFLPSGHQIIKGGLIVLFFSLFAWSFIKNSKKKYILLCIFSMFLFMWPAFLRYYSSRYLYKTLPFCVLIVLFLIKFYKSKTVAGKLKSQRISLIILYSFLIFNIFSLPYNLKKREQFLHKLDIAFTELSQDPKVCDKPICFVGLPWSIFPTGSAQAVWMKGITLPVYYDRRTWGASIRDIYQNWLNIEKIKNGFRLKTTNHDQVWIAANGQEEFAMGQKAIHDHKDGKVVDVSFIFDKKYLDQNPVFVTWDYETLKFIILE